MNLSTSLFVVVKVFHNIVCQAWLLGFLQIHDGKKPEVLVDGWNVYFFDDFKALVSVLYLICA